jgi:MFS family permease
VVRPFGALFFGRIGDLVGRKYAFLVTLLIMGGATALIGFLPTYATIGIAAPIILLLIRVLQGLALGGEYGGAAVYVAEHVPDERAASTPASFRSRHARTCSFRWPSSCWSRMR